MDQTTDRHNRHLGDVGETPDGAAPRLDPVACYRALTARDARFDGRFFVGVTSTGIYCRPTCPAPSAKFANCRFFRSAAAAREAGFRPCLRCRPETAPEIGTPETGAWAGTSNTVRRGLALIAEGALDDERHSIAHLASRLGLGERQLRRLFQEHLGASPIAVAQTRRIHLAKQLIHETRLPMAEIALAAGFGSVRRFNETFQALYQRPPSSLRRKNQMALSAGSVAVSGVVVRLPYRPPYDWPFMLSYLAARAIPGIEVVSGERYLRTVEIDGEVGSIEVAHDPASCCLGATLRFPCVKALPTLIARIKRVFDLGADLGLIGQHLAQDAILAPLIAKRPGLRAPGGWDGFELAIRAVLGQQVTVTAGRQLAARLSAICGSEIPASAQHDGALTRVFPSAAQVAGADLSSLGMPGARKRTLITLAEAALRDPDLFRAAADIDATIDRLRAIKGIGDWTAHYIALRVVREPDAFPASDIGILRGATPPGGVRPTPQALLKMAQAWRPWRAYAAQHLWAEDEARIMETSHG
ncbi:DNA-3-methyladenine glycosylase 2 family protein [Dongia rigui]|uniref:DNA-3-methyladenine glycosylase II n=1 Tax=Dongia rigui TaxID=940149 RepID=A0ABU5E338_9PROT|nr:AlkA N-terminal domain-containing protein [Dongia rigui]MDY0873936.1 AlkA N-terminal domain-containing protein [Dongia rigui]